MVVAIFLPEMVEEILPAEFQWLAMFAASPDRRPIDISPEARAQVRRVAHSLWSEIREANDHWELMVGLDVSRLLVTLSRAWQRAADEGPSRRGDPTELSRLMPAIAMASQDLKAKVGPREAAAACGLSPSRFHHLFRRTLGLSYGRFRLRARLAHAAHRLLTTDMPIEAIAEETGFVDASHLYRRFISQYGRSPGEYRKAGRLVPDRDDGIETLVSS
jgi:AraC-like DNA-binding protein